MNRNFLAAAVVGYGLLAGALPANAQTIPASESSNAREKLRSIGAVVVREVMDFRLESPLTAEQKDEIGRILQSHKPAIKAQIQQSAKARRDFRVLVKQHGSESPAALASADQIGSIARNRALLVAKIASEIKPVLTPEQQTKVSEALDKVESEVQKAVAD